MVSHDIIYEVLFLGSSPETKRMGLGTVLVDELTRRLFEHEEQNPSCKVCSPVATTSIIALDQKETLSALQLEDFRDLEDWARSWSRRKNHRSNDHQTSNGSKSVYPNGCICASQPGQRTLCVSIKSNSAEALGFWTKMGLTPLDENEPREGEIVKLMVPFADFCAVAVSFVSQKVAADFEAELRGGDRGGYW